jgi:hypothetical protein
VLQDVRTVAPHRLLVHPAEVGVDLAGALRLVAAAGDHRPATYVELVVERNDD